MEADIEGVHALRGSFCESFDVFPCVFSGVFFGKVKKLIFFSFVEIQSSKVNYEKYYIFLQKRSILLKIQATALFTKNQFLCPADTAGKTIPAKTR